MGHDEEHAIVDNRNTCMAMRLYSWHDAKFFSQMIGMQMNNGAYRGGHWATKREMRATIEVALYLGGGRVTFGSGD